MHYPRSIAYFNAGVWAHGLTRDKAELLFLFVALRHATTSPAAVWEQGVHDPTRIATR
jgi:hypothetical protein